MNSIPRLLVVAIATGCLSSPASGITVRVENLHGSVTARVVNTARVGFRRTCQTREIRPNDTIVEQKPGLIAIRAEPADGAPIDIEVSLPYGFDFQARTGDGPITVNGLVRGVELITGAGDITLAVPWNATRLEVNSREEPKEVSLPGGIKFNRRKLGGKHEEPGWLLTDKLPPLSITYSKITIQANAPGRLMLENLPIPDDSPIKLPWQAPRIVDELLAGRKRPGPASEPNPKANAGDQTRPDSVERGIPRFSTDVRLVNLTAAVVDRQGHPISDLEAEDFEVIEDGVPQRVTFAASAQTPFNLALLLDLSGSTRRDRASMKEAARRFIGIARPHDRVAVYALASSMFYVVSPLTQDRQRLEKLIDLIPEVSGGTPLYDVIALAYAQEFRQRPAGRNALIIISDGIDNQVYGTNAASKVPFKKLLRAAGRMNALIYPIFLDPFTKVPPPKWALKARQNMQALAEETGGRLFVAQSIRDLDPVYPQVAEELRSVHAVGYYPRNQVFDGSWRGVRVRVKRSGARVRTRTGYFAR